MVSAIGWSLGANILVNYLGEEGKKSLIDSAISLCNPFDLTLSDEQFQLPFNKTFYDASLTRKLKAILKRNQVLFEQSVAVLVHILVNFVVTMLDSFSLRSKIVWRSGI